MSDPRFARLKTDPRFRRLKREKNKVVVDGRFKHIFDRKAEKKNSRVDKYGRPLSGDHEHDNLRRFYRLDDEAEAQLELKPGPDYARGEVLLESSDEDDQEPNVLSEESDVDGVVTLGRDVTQPIPVPGDVEVDLDEDTYSDLDAQAAAFAQANPNASQSSVQCTRRIAVVNLDWEHVRAIHLYKIFSSLVSPTGAPMVSGNKDNRTSHSTSVPIARGKVLSVRVYPSEFGKERMAKEEKEGPPSDIFKKKRELAPEEINERTIYDVGDGEDYDEDALRNYQLERLRYYYAIVECDTVQAASHIYNELEGTELERSANVFDLSFVPDDMTFENEFRDEARDDFSIPYRPLEFTTDALRHSKVKLTWDEDEPERAFVTKRILSRKEIEENDFRAYIASSSSSEADEPLSTASGKSTQVADREKLRALLLGGRSNLMPEGWGTDKGGRDEDDVDMEITFTPGLSAVKDEQDETTLQRYQRRMKEKKKRKEEVRPEKTEHKTKDKKNSKSTSKNGHGLFSGGSDEEEVGQTREPTKAKDLKRKINGRSVVRVESTAEELALLAASNNPTGEVKHFDMKAVLHAEKKGGKKKKGKKGKRGADDGENELQQDFSIDVKDDRFKAVLEDHTFAIDPTNPHFKKTRSMATLLEERSRRQQEKVSKKRDSTVAGRVDDPEDSQSILKSLVDSVKRKGAAGDAPFKGKRRKIS